MTEWIEEDVSYSDIGVGSEIMPLDSETGLPDNHVLTIRERRITVDENILIQNNVKTDTITLDLDAEWDDVEEIIVIFTDMRFQSVEKIYEAPAVAIPASAQDEVGTLEVSVVGYNADHSMRLVTVYAPAIFEVIRSGKITGSITPDEADDMLAQLASAAEAATNAAAAANSAAASVDEATDAAESAATAANEASATATQAAQQVADAMDGLEDATDAAETASANATSAALSAQAAAQAAQAAAESATDNVLRGEVAETDVASADEAWKRAPLELQVYGNTRQNLWSNDWTIWTSAGMVIEEKPDGAIHVDSSECTINNPTGRYVDTYVLKPGSKYVAFSDKSLGNTTENSFWVQMLNESGASIQDVRFGYSVDGEDILSTTFTCPEGTVSTRLMVYVHDIQAGVNDGDFKVMLYEADPSENLWVNPSMSGNGCAAAPNPDGTVAVSGTASANGSFLSTAIEAKPSTTYTLSVDKATAERGFYASEYDGDEGIAGKSHYVAGSQNSALSTTFTTTASTDRFVIGFGVNANDAVREDSYKVMLNEGSSAKPWVPRAGYPLRPWCPPGIHSVGELMEHEKNLWVNPATETKNGVTLTSNADGSVSIKGTSTGQSYFNVADVLSLKPSTEYTFSVDNLSPGFNIVVREDSDSQTNLAAHSLGGSNKSLTFTTLSNMAKGAFYIGVATGYSFDITLHVMLNEGSEAMPWVPPSCESAVQVVTAGKNLSGEYSPVNSNSANVEVYTENGRVYFNGTIASAAQRAIAYPELKIGKKYVISKNDDSCYVFVNDGSNEEAPVRLITISNDVHSGILDLTGLDHVPKFYLGISPKSGITYDNTDVSVQIELGETPTEFEPSNVVTTPVPLSGHTLAKLPDGTRDVLTVGADGSAEIDQGTIGETFDGGENWTAFGTHAGSGGGYYDLKIVDNVDDAVVLSESNSLSENFRLVSFGGSVDNTGIIGYGNGTYSFRLRPYDEPAQNADTFKTWLAAHPQRFVLSRAEHDRQQISLDAVTLPPLPPTWNMWIQPNANGVPATLAVEYERNITTAIQNLEALRTGSVIFIGEGAPTSAIKAREGDRYLDETTGKIYELVEVEVEE